MTKKEKDEIELNIEAKYVGRTEKEFLSIITYPECLYILDTKNNYCDEIKYLSLLKLVDLISKLEKELDNRIPIKDIKDLKEKIHWELDKNGITRGYQIIIDEYFNELLNKE